MASLKMIDIKGIQERVAKSRLAKNRLLILTWRTVHELGDDDATHMAAGVAYYVLFSLFPLLLGLIAIMGIFLKSQTIQQEVVDFVADYIPGSEDFIKTNVDSIVRFRGALGVASIIGLFWSASAVFGAITRAINRAWDVKRDRPFYISKPRQLAMALGVSLLFLLSLGATSLIQSAGSTDLHIPGQSLLFQTAVVNLALRTIPWAITFTIFLLIYKLVPNCKTYWRYVWPGAVVAALLFEIAKSLFVWYLDNFASYNQVYGNLASVIVLLFWAYLSSFILILGAEISSEYERLPREKPGAQTDPLPK